MHSDVTKLSKTTTSVHYSYYVIVMNDSLKKKKKVNIKPYHRNPV